jgi:hypothetical protein
MSEVKVNKISPRSGTEVTLGDSGDTFTIPSGATINNQGTATNFGATGSASWNTTVKTGDFTAVAGEGYFVNTTSGEIDVTLPAGSAGDVIAVSDYARNFQTNNCILVRNGSDKISGDAVNPALSTEGIAVTLVYVDSTKGWIVTDSGNQDDAPTSTYICASVSGSCNTLATCGDYKIATFKGPGNFTVNSTGNPAGSDKVDYLVVAGGGGGGGDAGGGGGAGGFRLANHTSMPAPQTSPLANPSGTPVTAQAYPITIGGGGAGYPAGTSPAVKGTDGTPSVFSSITSTSGGGGAGGPGGPNAAGTGGSGGGGRGSNPAGGAGNTPPVSPAQGTNGGNGPAGGAGGGGAATAGTPAGPSSPTPGGPGGTGSYVASAGFAGCNGTTGPVSGARYFSGGGGGSADQPGPSAGTGGTGGGGAGTTRPTGSPGTNGTALTGGGGGGGGVPSPGSGGGNGGSGIVIIRYKFQN